MLTNFSSTGNRTSKGCHHSSCRIKKMLEDFFIYFDLFKKKLLKNRDVHKISNKF